MANVGNNNKHNSPIDQTPGQNDQVIYHTLKTLDARVDELKADINRSAQMLPLGVDTDLTVFIKDTINNPILQLLKMKENVDSNVGSFITLLVTRFLETQQDKIKKAFRTETGNNDLHFSIILKEDNLENRNAIFCFLRDYKTTNLWASFPVYFQIVPSEISDKISAKEILFENT